MKTKSPSFLFFLVLIQLLLLNSCKPSQSAQDPLPSWNSSKIKTMIINYLNDSIQTIPITERVAVFDMDGTIACEEPLWMEMYAAVYGLNLQSAHDSSLLQKPEYRYASLLAQNPKDTSVTNHWSPFIDSMIWKAWKGVDNEVYIDSSFRYLARTRNVDYHLILADMFYQPMLELIQLLRSKHFKVYIVSGSIQGLIWSIVPKKLHFSRAQLIGTTQKIQPQYDTVTHHTAFILEAGIYQPKNNGDGKAKNIYSHIGKTPVFAFGNTTGDFGMFHLTSTSPYPHMSLLLNHNDSAREYAYPPYHQIDSLLPDTTAVWKYMQDNHWIRVDMRENFNIIWMKTTE